MSRQSSNPFIETLLQFFFSKGLQDENDCAIVCCLCESKEQMCETTRPGSMRKMYKVAERVLHEDSELEETEVR